MKTPEEIKKGLEVCTAQEDCVGCPYTDGDAFFCDRLRKDAFAYIQQLEDAIDKTTQLMQSATEVIKKNQEQLESTYSQVKKALCGKENVSWVEVLEAADQLKSRLAQAERERDAAVADLSDRCLYCKNAARKLEEPPCADCMQPKNGILFAPRVRTHFEWRGVCPENTKEDGSDE